MKRQFVTMTASALVAAAMLTACGGKTSSDNTSSGTVVRGGTFTSATIADATVLNPILYQDTFTNEVLMKLYDGLLKSNDKLEMVPNLAKEMPTLEDGGKKWTFKLRTGVKWHDGVDFTSADVKFTYTAVLHPGYTGTRTSYFINLKGASALRNSYKAIDADVKAGKLTQEAADKQKAANWEAWVKSDAIQTPDKETVILLFDKADAPALVNVGGFRVIPEHSLNDQVGTKMKTAAFNKNPIGTGAFKLAEWKANERIVLKANDAYHFGRPNIDQYVFRVFPDKTTAMNALEKGEIDRAEVDVDQFDRFQNDVKNVQMFQNPSLNYRSIVYDLHNPLFQEKNVRQALTYAVDKENLVQKLLNGHGISAWTHSAVARWDFNQDVPKLNFNKAKAEQLLDTAGWKKGADGIRAKDGKKFSFELYYVSNEKLDAQAGQVVQDAWKQIGVEAQLKGVEKGTLIDMSDASNPARKQPPAYLLGWSVGSEPDSYVIWHTDGSFNDIGYSNKEVDDLLLKGRLEMDKEKRKAIYAQIQAKLADDQPYMWLWFPNTINGVSKRVKGPIAGTPAGIEWNISEWYINGK